MSGSWAKPLGKRRARPAVSGLVALAAGLGTFLVYLQTLAPTISTNDAARFQISAPVLGTGHPTGYPTFILLGKLFTLLPVGDPAYRVNLMAAVFGATAAALLVLVVRELGGRLLPAAGAAALLAFSATFWSQATVAEVYTMHTAFMLGVTYLLLRWRYKREPVYLLSAAVLYGFSLGNNAGMVLLAPAYLILALIGRRRELTLKRLLSAAALGIVGASVYLYIPLRGFAGAWHNYGDPVNNWSDVWRLVSGARFQNLMASSPQEAFSGLGSFVWGLSLQVPHPPGFILAAGALTGGAYGLWVLVRRDAVVGGALVVALGCTLLYAASYRIPDVAVYYIPVYVLLFLTTAVAASDLAGRLRRAPSGLSAGHLVLAAPLLAAGLALALNFEEQDRSGYRAERERAEEAFAALPPDAIVYGKVEVLPMTYLRQVEGEREDLSLRWLDGATLEEHFAADLSSGRPVYFVEDPLYTERYLQGVEGLANPREQDGLVRLVPEPATPEPAIPEPEDSGS